MEEKKPFGEKLSEFFAGKGFYIVLLLCAALIGASIWQMTSGSGTDVELNGKETETVMAGAAAETAPEAERTVETMGRIDLRRGELPLSGTETEAEVPGEAAQTADAAPEPVAPLTAAEPVSVPEEEYFIWPVNGVLGRGFSLETLSYDPTMADWRLHAAWDILAPAGENVLAVLGGTVTGVTQDPMLGTVVELTHRDGLVSVYANLDDEPVVSVGQKLAVGGLIGRVGSTALSESGEESHLHFSMYQNGRSVDPAGYLPAP